MYGQCNQESCRDYPNVLVGDVCAGVGCQVSSCDIDPTEASAIYSSAFPVRSPPVRLCSGSRPPPPTPLLSFYQRQGVDPSENQSDILDHLLAHVHLVSHVDILALTAARRKYVYVSILAYVFAQL